MNQNQFGIGSVNRKDLKAYLIKVRKIDANNEVIVTIPKPTDIISSPNKSISYEDIKNIVSPEIISGVVYQKADKNQAQKSNFQEICCSSGISEVLQ